MNYENTLNEEQLKPVTDTEGQVLVLAGAGSGKTRVLTYRIAYLINEKHVSPYNILAITFTNKAANEMKERLAALAPSSEIWVSTFHSLCARILRMDAEKLGYNSSYSIYSESDSDRLIKRIFAERNIEDTEAKNNARFHINRAKTLGLTPAEYEKEFSFVNDISLYCSVYAKYDAELKKNNAMDFDDLLIKTAELFVNHPEVLKKYQERFRYVHIDEFQDTSRLQYLIVRLIAMKYRNIFAVGDDDQSIYSWRGADITNIQDFRKDYPEAKLYKLERNYRSTPQILEAANAVIRNNSRRIGKELWTENGAGARVEINNAVSDRSEADYVVETISELIRTRGYKPSDFAILVRLNALTRLFEERLNLYNIPYVVFKGHKFFERKEIKDLIAYLRLVVNPLDTESIARIINFPKRGIGDTTVAKLREYADRNGKTLFDAVLDIDGNDEFSASTKAKISGFRDVATDLIKNSAILPMGEFMDYLTDRIQLRRAFDGNKEDDESILLNIGEFVQSVKEFEKANEGSGIKEYLESVSLISDMDTETEQEHVTLATIHAVKGLEFKVVFVVALEEGVFPAKRAITSPDEMEEERRVMYVAMTRAEERLYLTSANCRFKYKEVQYNVVSRFVKELQGTMPKPAKSLPFGDQGVNKDNGQFVCGAKVRHEKFGVGMIVGAQGEGKDKIINVSFEGLGVKTFLLRLAPIKVING
ncbi:MAG: ATP-dependent helicase [Christensenellales bacterium]